ncbi:BEN domain-containing protein 5-like [Ixodes scapularis]|uniref:BEN domain-containing protein 5-like n=1 Tax=Ixodes scapularis TaxID=6945 RepID=UPI001C39221E|nr:BEN domain-containing protein 5-like [Ixodes scapularis]
MNFAYVQYFTGTERPKTIISTSAIKNFEPRSEDDYKKGHLYDALLTPDGGEPGCFKAQILLLADSKSSIEERIKRGKRIPLPKVLDQVVEHSSSEDDQAALRVEMAQQKLNRTREATAKMKQIISEKLSQKRKNPLFPEARSAKHARYESHSDTDSGDDGAVVPKKLYDDLHQKYLALKKTTRELKEDVEKMRTREAKNTDILDVILEGVNSIKSKLESTGAGCSINANTKHDIVKKAKLRTDGRTVCVNDSVTLSLDQWVTCQRQKKESKFVRSLATAIWGRNILKNRSTSGKVSNRLINDGGAAKPPLTPTKLNVLEACYEDWLREHGASGDVLAERMAAMTTHINSAVRDLAVTCGMR